MALDQHGALLKMVVMISQHRLRSWRRPPPSAFLLLCNAKASNYRENKVFKGLAYYSKWPKVADAVIEATTPLYRKTVLVLAVIVHMLKYAQMGSEKGCRSCKKLALRDNRPINKCLKDVEGSLHHLTSPVGKVGFSAHWCNGGHGGVYRGSYLVGVCLSPCPPTGRARPSSGNPVRQPWQPD